MRREQSYKEIVSLAEHYLAIGMEEVYLSAGDEAPWEYVTAVRAGGSHRLDMDTSIWFTAVHPCGLSFRWSMEIETREANGQGRYVLDIPRIQAVFLRLPPDGQRAFARYLAECSEKVSAKGEEYAELAGSQYRDAAILRQIARDGAA